MPERKTTDRKPTEEEKPAQTNGQQVSRRGFLLGAGAGVAGLAVGGVAGSQVFPKQTAEAPLAVPTTFVGREFTTCTGCRLCQIACSQVKENGKIWPSASRIEVYEYQPGVEFPVLCYQCADNAKCVEKCPAQALSVDPKTITVVVDTKKCLRTAKNGDCTICRDECPGTAVMFHPVSKAPLICDTCNGDPACAKVCPSLTLTKNGIKAAPVKPAEIAARLAKMYEVPPPPKAEQLEKLLAEVGENPFA